MAKRSPSLTPCFNPASMATSAALASRPRSTASTRAWMRGGAISAGLGVGATGTGAAESTVAAALGVVAGRAAGVVAAALALGGRGAGGTDGRGSGGVVPSSSAVACSGDIAGAGGPGGRPGECAPAGGALTGSALAMRSTASASASDTRPLRTSSARRSSTRALSLSAVRRRWARACIRSAACSAAGPASAANAANVATEMKTSRRGRSMARMLEPAS